MLFRSVAQVVAAGRAGLLPVPASDGVTGLLRVPADETALVSPLLVGDQTVGVVLAEGPARGIGEPGEPVWSDGTAWQQFAQLGDITLQNAYNGGNSITLGAATFEVLPGVDGDELIRILRRRTDAGVLVVSGKVGASVFEAVIDAGADMYLEKPVSLEQILLVAKALYRRAVLRGQREQSWVVDLRASQLLAPDGAKVDLSDTDMTVMRCFLEADGGIVTRDTLIQRLGRDGASTLDNTLHATIYRLRRRIEKASTSLVPLQSEPRVGYVFRAPLKTL